MASARLFMQESDKVEKLSRYEQRLTRTFTVTLNQFREIQAERKKREVDQLYQAGMIRKLLLMQKKPFRPADYGFVLTTVQVDTDLHLNDILDQARLAHDVGYNLEKFRARTAPTRSEDDHHE